MNQIDDNESEVILDGQESDAGSSPSEGEGRRQEEILSPAPRDDGPAPNELAPGQEPPFPDAIEPGLRWVLNRQVELRLDPHADEFDRLILNDIRDTLMVIVKPRNRQIALTRPSAAAAPPAPAPGSDIEVTPQQSDTILRIQKMKDRVTMKQIEERRAAAKAARHAH